MNSFDRKAEYRGTLLARRCHLVTCNADNRGAESLDVAITELRRIEDKFSAYTPDSVVSQINEDAGKGRFTPLDAESRSLLNYVSTLWEESRHMFDPTSRPLQSAYGGHQPLKGYKSILAQLLPLVAWEKLEITAQGARLAEPGVILDLDSCIRPYAVDCARKKLVEREVSSALIDLGTDTATIGRQPDGSNWLIGVRYPKGAGASIRRIKLNQKGYAIRGNFEQCLTMDGERFSRTLSPVDGQPIPGLLSIGVVADRALDACSAVNVARLKTEQSALKWLAEIGLPWFAVDRQLNCHGPLAES
jgi:thiamine biosynthesis lipoprotein